MRGVTPEERFWAKVDKTETCWLWIGAQSRTGYGSFGVKRKTHYVHRLAYEWLIGPIPEKLVIDHLCRVRNCVNPDHMEIVSHRENTLRGVGPAALNSAKTHCKRGHLLDEQNTRMCNYLHYVFRKCITCDSDYQRSYRAMKVSNRIPTEKREIWN